MGQENQRDQAFVNFYQQNHAKILETAKRRLSDAEAAADATAAAFEIAWRHHLRGGELNLPWLFTVLRNVIGNEYQRVARLNSLVTKLESTSNPTKLHGSPDTTLEVRKAVSALSEAERKVLYLSYWRGCTCQQIADILAITPNAVRVRLTRARQNLKTRLNLAS